MVSSSLTSVTQRFPPASTVIPCGYANSPAPKLFKSFPDGSNSRIGGFAGPRPMQVAEPAGSVLKQRWKTHTLPLGSTWTRMTSPHFPPFMSFGSFGQPSTRRYGLGSSVGFGYLDSDWLLCATGTGKEHKIHK